VLRRGPGPPPASGESRCSDWGPGAVSAACRQSHGALALLAVPLKKPHWQSPVHWLCRPVPLKKMQSLALAPVHVAQSL